MELIDLNSKNINDTLLEDLKRVYKDGGGINMFLNDDKLLELTLLKLFGTPPPQTEILLNLRVVVPWMEWGKRLSYKEGINTDPTDYQVEDATVKSWKEPSEVSQVLSELTKLDGAK